ncbi:MAG TPA: CarD family transcriptional regulator, partial [Amphiplicatus sp.]|nr:CarD family transcriptional regulator [Amphiplicatus sp.]
APEKKAAAKPAKAKAPAKSAAEAAPAKPAATKAPAAKTAAKAAAKPAAAKKAVKAAEPKAKATKAAKKAEAPAKAAPKKKMLVGQKPRGDKANGTLAPSAPPSPTKATGPIADAAVTASPPSAEAKQDFKVNDYIVYPAHGVGRIVGIEKQLIAGVTNELFLIDFEQEKMRLRVPTGKAKAVGMRGLSDANQIKKAIELLKGRARIKRTMWSRRAQEYEAKINSGDIISVAEVVRDLFRASDQPEQSYSERQLFEAALDRLAREVAAINKTDMAAAIGLLENTLQQRKAA